MRSLLTGAVALGLLVGSVGSSEARTRKQPQPLTVAQAKAQASKVIAQERANKFGARERIGGDFTVALKYCELNYGDGRPWRASCSYWITAKNPTSTAPQDGSAVRRRCVVSVEVRKSKRTGRLTHTRKAHPCYEPQPPVQGPPVGGGPGVGFENPRA